MKLNKGEEIEYFDDNEVDFRHKRKAIDNNAVNIMRVHFCPEDPMVDTNMAEMMPSVNKQSDLVSIDFYYELSRREYKLNKGKNSRTKTNPFRGSYFRDLVKDLEKEIDGSPDE